MRISENIEVWTNVIAGDKVVTDEDDDAANEVGYKLECGELTATNVPQKFAYGNGKFLFYMRVDEIEDMEAAYALLDQVYAKEKESQS